MISVLSLHSKDDREVSFALMTKLSKILRTLLVFMNYVTRTLIDTLLCQILGSAASLISFANLTMSLGLYRFVFIPSDFHSHLAQHAVRPRDSSKPFATIARLDRFLIRE